MTVYYLYKDSQHELTCDSASQGIIDSFQRYGCVTLSETNFLSEHVQPTPNDVVIVYISLRNELCHEKLRRLGCKKVLHSMDESKSDEILFRTQLEFCRRHDVNVMINTFPSKRNIEFLSRNGINTITMPFCGSPREVDFLKKDIDVLVSGQINPSYYPIRSKVLDALRKSDVKFAYLPHSGIEASKAVHQYHGKKFHELLDRCWMGVTCKAGTFRDRLVPKYVEFGFSKVLPIGDCPSYMDSKMEESMVKIEDNDSSDTIIEKIKSALSDKDKLKNRIESYSSVAHKDHDMDVNTKRTIQMVLSENFDTSAVTC